LAFAGKLSKPLSSDKNQKRLCDVEALFAYEKQLYAEGARVVVGIDEVGRGPVAGPVTAAAVVLGADWQPVTGLNDSKLLSPARREEIAAQLVESVQAYHVAHVDADFIDEKGIMPALRLAMQRAVEGLNSAQADAILIDGLPLGLFEQEEAIVKGDSKIACIAAASVLAKVARDALMVEASQDYPAYGFDSNKGYASAAHRQAIAEYGLTPLHRRSFCHNFLQESLF